MKWPQNTNTVEQGHSWQKQFKLFKALSKDVYNSEVYYNMHWTILRHINQVFALTDLFI
jgi:hypothetical protein